MSALKNSMSGVACRGEESRGEGEDATTWQHCGKSLPAREAHLQSVRGSLEVPNANLSGLGSCGELTRAVRGAYTADVVSEGFSAPEDNVHGCSGGHFAPLGEMADGKSSKVSPPSPSPPQEKVLAQFQQLRQEQRALSAKIAEIEADRSEHK